MIKSLFFSLPSDTYASPEQGRHVYQAGMYALCRHPGVLWYCMFFLFVALTLRMGVAFACCSILCAGNIAYMFFQEKWSFPRTFCDYDVYQQKVPLTTYEDYADILLARREDMLPAPAVTWVETTWEGGKRPIKLAPYTQGILDAFRRKTKPLSCLLVPAIGESTT